MLWLAGIIVGKQYQRGCSTEEREICGERLMREFLCMCVLVKRQFFERKSIVKEGFQIEETTERDFCKET